MPAKATTTNGKATKHRQRRAGEAVCRHCRAIFTVEDDPTVCRRAGWPHCHECRALIDAVKDAKDAIDQTDHTLSEIEDECRECRAVRDFLFVEHRTKGQELDEKRDEQKEFRETRRKAVAAWVNASDALQARKGGAS